ncbi:hypothetical protein K437DRAFT_121305 [Tilletiaria anomala UBC 951]|uniref:Uncharacterized protein n=1 Tax=Tilletiaria anomala (strain ATCC 24038 / CBS 436.72 / UBC 951) TaxID=1037660 RepID=A0A066W499_TILAU|nr:uncharacterized protein K437DRAFT_121305 [Tilletiaria anomala UBC 951]KDN45620.1 hypothetical protein K437DRAFT_121305 [Tilletiaria anomala UBC 951]
MPRNAAAAASGGRRGTKSTSGAMARTSSRRAPPGASGKNDSSLADQFTLTRNPLRKTTAMATAAVKAEDGGVGDKLKVKDRNVTTATVPAATLDKMDARAQEEFKKQLSASQTATRRSKRRKLDVLGEMSVDTTSVQSTSIATQYASRRTRLMRAGGGTGVERQKRSSMQIPLSTTAQQVEMPSSAVPATLDDGELEYFDIPSTPPQIRWQRQEDQRRIQQAKATVHENGQSGDSDQSAFAHLPSTPPHIRWQREEQGDPPETSRDAPSGESVQILAQKPTEEAEEEDQGTSDKENTKPANARSRALLIHLQTRRGKPSAPSSSSSNSRADATMLDQSNALGLLAVQEPVHSTPIAVNALDQRRKPPQAGWATGRPAPGGEALQGVGEELRRENGSKIRRPLAPLKIAEAVDIQLGGVSASKKRSAETLDDLLGMNEGARGQRDRRALLPDRADKDSSTAAITSFPPQDPERLQRWLNAHARESASASATASPGGAGGPNLTPPSPPSTQLDDRQNDRARAQRNHLRSRAPGPNKDADDECAFNTGQRDDDDNAAARMDAEHSDDDPFGIMQEIRATSRIQRRKGLYVPRPHHSPSQSLTGFTASRYDARNPLTHERAPPVSSAALPRANRLAVQEGSKDEHGISALSSCSSPLTSVAHETAPQNPAANSGGGLSLPPASSPPRVQDLLELLPKRAGKHINDRKASGASNKRGRKGASKVQHAPVKSVKRQIIKLSKSPKHTVRALRDSSSESGAGMGDKLDIQQSTTLPRARAGLQPRSDSIQLSPRAVAERKARLQLYHDLDHYALGEELVL